ncbi:Peptidase M1 [Gracilaria domingensis]|nr:Peptidase M1 [Gracilaria domingensis]
MPCAAIHFASSADPFSGSYATPHYQPRLPLRPTHLSLDLRFSIPKRTVRGIATHSLKAQWHGAHVVTLHAEDFDQVQVTSPEDDMLSFSYDGHLIQAVFSYPLPKDETVKIVVSYQVVDPVDGLLFSRENEGHWVVSDHETERARYWLPVVDHPSVRTTLSFKLRTPAEEKLTALANGELVSEEIEGPEKVSQWEMRQITPSYLICVAIGRFVTASGGEQHGKPIKFFGVKGGRHPYTEEDLAFTFGRTKEMIIFMENKVQFELPWPKYYQFCVGDVGGAMENSSLVSYDEWYMLDERSSSERAHRVDSTVVHELAHTWFGDMVVCSDFCHSFLKESFATLISAEWYHYKNGEEEFQNTLTKYAETSFAETLEYVRPIVCRKYESSWSLFDRHLYTNGAWRLHMLRNKLGNDTFWSAVSHYLHKRAWQTVEADDFRRDLEEFSNEQLCSFFDQWFYGKGHPVLEVSFAYDASKGGCASITVKQVQADEKKGIGLFDITIDIAIEVSSGTWETHTLTMESGASTAQLVDKVPAKPLQLVVDPEKKVLHNLTKLNGVGDDMHIRSLSHAPTFAGRYQSAKFLFESGSRRARVALRDALKKDSHWGIRSAIAVWLGKAGRKESLPALIDAAFHESDARATPAILSALGEFRESESEQALLKFIHEGHDMMRPYGAMGMAIRGLGKMRKIEHLELIQKFLEEFRMGGKSFEIPLAAASALGHMCEWKAIEVIIKNSSPPNLKLPNRVRCGLLYALTHGMEFESAANRLKVFDFVERLCKSEERSMVAMAAARVLVSFSDVGNPLNALNELEKRVSAQSKPVIRKLRERARKKLSMLNSHFKESAVTIEKMQKDLKELERKVEDLQAKLDAQSATKKEDSKKANHDKQDVVADGGQ